MIWLEEGGVCTIVDDNVDLVGKSVQKSTWKVPLVAHSGHRDVR